MSQDKQKIKKVKEAAEPAPIDGAIVYADAGVRPTNPGFGGWGFHGYLYSSEPPKKSNGPANWALTAKGYSPKSVATKEVTAHYFLDAFGTIPHISNNGAEIVAATKAMEELSRSPHAFKNITIKTDSRYVITGAQDYLVRWKNNNWCKSDGQQVSNIDHWKALDHQLSTLKTNGVLVDFEWVKGHNGDHGNELADTYATIGVLTSGKGHFKQMVQTAEAQAYWKPEDDSHPLLALPRLYFITDRSTINPGEYYTGHHGKDDALIGKRMADGSYAYVQLDTPDPYIEMLYKKQLAISDTQDNIIMARLDHLLDAKTKRGLLIFGEDMLVPEGKTAAKSQNLILVGGKNEKGEAKGESLSLRLNPPLIAIRAVESVNFLKGMFLAWKDGTDDQVVKTNITDAFYVKDKKDATKLSAEFISTTQSVTVKAFIDKDRAQQLEFQLSVNVDIPHRNVFKHLEKLNPTLTLFVWKESETAYRYATLFEVDGGKALWCGFYSNVRYLFQK